MSEMWKKWEGQIVDQKYQLQRCLGSTDHSVVFEAESQDAEPRRAAVKFVSADVAEREQQLAAWSTASQLSHPNLLRVYGAGQCRIENLDLLYVALEYAEENLAQVLPTRALLAEETSEMLNSIVEVLVYLHGKNLVHGHVKPSNILATRETLKLSSDTVFAAGEAREMRRERSGYDAPELPDRPYTAAADVWSLGVTLVEALTQQPTVLPFNEQADPVIPAVIRDPYLDIARHSLRREPRMRWSSTQIAERLNPSAVTAKAVAAGAGARASAGVAFSAANAANVAAAPSVMSPLNVPLSKEPAIPLAKQPMPPIDRRAEVRRAPQHVEGELRREKVLLPNYVIPLFAGALLVIALIVLPFALHHGTKPAPSAVNTANTAPPNQLAATQSNATSVPVTPTAKPAPAQPAAEPAKPSPTLSQPKSETVPTVVHDPTAPPPGKTKSSGASLAAGEALDKVAPEVPAKALATIHGTVRIGVKVHVDAAGNVSEATLQDPGPSQYFANLSLKAARRWVFTPPEVDGRSVPSDWLIQLHFTQSGVQMNSQQVAP